MYEQLTQSKIKDLREEILKKQNFKCAICGKDISNLDGVSLDHQHRISKSQEIGDDGAKWMYNLELKECHRVDKRKIPEFLEKGYQYGRIRNFDNFEN